MISPKSPNPASSVSAQRSASIRVGRSTAMSGTRDECVFMARLAEQAERFEDMVELLGWAGKSGDGEKDGLLGLETHDIYLTFGFFMDTKGISLGRTSKEWWQRKLMSVWWKYPNFCGKKEKTWNVGCLWLRNWYFVILSNITTTNIHS